MHQHLLLGDIINVLAVYFDVVDGFWGASFGDFFDEGDGAVGSQKFLIRH